MEKKVKIQDAFRELREKKKATREDAYRQLVPIVGEVVFNHAWDLAQKEVTGQEEMSWTEQ
eukprot:7346-Eustigmatos_ZCMA.PRE.1